MANYTVEDPQTGKKVSFMWGGKEAPTDTDLDEIFTEASKISPKQTLPQIENMPWYQKALVGIGAGMQNAGIGATQRVLEGGELIRNAFGLQSNQQNIDKLQNLYQTNKEAMQPLTDESLIARGGEIIGGALPYVAIPGGVAGGALKRAGTAALSGAGIGALQPTTKDDSSVTNALLGAVGGGAVSGATSGLSKAINSVAGKIPLNKAYELSQKYGVRATLGEITQNPLWQKTETWLEQVPLIGLKSFRKKQDMEAQTAATNFFAKYVHDPNANSTAMMKEMNDSYLDGIFTNVKKNMANLPSGEAPVTKDAASELLKRFPSVFQSIQDNNVKGILKNIAAETMDKNINTGLVSSAGKSITRTETPKFSANDLWELRKGIGKEINKERRAGNETAEGILKKVYSSVSDDMDNLLAKGGSKEIQAFKNANDAFKQYSLKFDVLREAYDKAAGTTGAGELFSPKKFSTTLKNLANDPNYKKNVKWTPQEIDEMTGLANILQVTKRAGQYMENPPTGNRWGGLMVGTGVLGAPALAGGVSGAVGGLATAGGIVGITRFLTSTTAGKNLALAASKIEPTSPLMKTIVDQVMNQSSKMAAVGVAQ